MEIKEIEKRVGELLQEYYESKIKDAQAYNETLISEKSNLNSEEYIEKIAREKLNMYTENERVYIDINN